MKGQYCKSFSEDLDLALAGVEGVEAPGTPPKTSKKVANENKAKAGNIAPTKRQSHIDELLHKTRRGAIAKNVKAAQKATSTAGGHLLQLHMHHGCAEPGVVQPTVSAIHRGRQQKCLQEGLLFLQTRRIRDLKHDFTLWSQALRLKR